MSAKLLTKVSAIFFIFGFILISGFDEVFADDTIRIAVLDFQTNNTSKYASAAVSEFISMEMANKTELTVIERKQIGAILNEQGFQQTGCTDQECAVQMGKLLSAKKILLGTLSKTGKVFVITAKSVDVETGRIDFAESERCMKEEDLELASKILAVKLANNVAGTSYTIPVRTYQQDESRNRFAMGLFYKIGIIKNVNFPVLEGEIDSLKLKSVKLDIPNQTVMLSPSYEILKNVGIRMDFKYMSYKIKEDIEYSSYSNDNLNETFMYNYESWFSDGYNHGYGLALNLQLIYPVDGFSFYLIPGIGLDKYNLKNPSTNSGYYHQYNDSLVPANSYSVSRDFDIEMDTDIYAYLFKLETGFSVYVSRYVDLYCAAGIDFHLFSKFISDVEIKSKEADSAFPSSGPIPSDEIARLENPDDEFEGNFPPEYYLQVGLVLRMF
jgi:TolB-like protein